MDYDYSRSIKSCWLLSAGLKCESSSLSVVSDFLLSHGLRSPWNSPGQNTEVGFPSPGDLPSPGIIPTFPALQADCLPAEPQGKPKNTGMGGLSLLQHIFSTQELNQCLLHCRWILYQLSYQRSPSVSLILITDGAMLFNISLLSGLLFVLHMKLVLSLKNKSVQMTSPLTTLPSLLKTLAKQF